MTTESGDQSEHVATLIEAAAPFARVAVFIDRLPDRRDDLDSFRHYCSEAWPTVGDVRKLRNELVRLGWKP